MRLNTDFCQATNATAFTVVEAVVTMLVLTIAALSLSSVLNMGIANSADPLWRVRATALARAYYEEIAPRRYDEQSPAGGVPPCSPATVPCSAAAAFDDGESRALFDDVDDYDGLDELPPLDISGNVRPGYERYRVTVDVSYADAGTVSALGLDDTSDAKMISIAVTAPGEDPLTFSFVRANY